MRPRYCISYKHLGSDPDVSGPRTHLAHLSKSSAVMVIKG